MGRKLFLSHLADARRSKIENTHNIHSPEDGVIAFTYVYPNSNGDQVKIEAFANDLGEYPDGNSFVLCTKDTSIDTIVAATLDKVNEDAHGKSVVDLLTEVAELLTRAITKDCVQEDIVTDHSMEDDEFDFVFEGDSDNECFGLVACDPGDTGRSPSTPVDFASLSTDPQKMEKIRADLRALKQSGFRVGIFGNIASAGILCISIRVSKLGLSDEALQAWNVARKKYFLLLIRYTRGYLDAARVALEPDLSDSVQMRVGLCDQYKPSLREILTLYQFTKPDNATQADDTDNVSADRHAFEALFIGNALNQLLEERAFKIIAARELYGLSWPGAEKFVNERQASSSSSAVGDMTPFRCDDDGGASSLPPVVVADHMRRNRLAKASLPLILMQFTLRHFVRCTEFCLVCHCRVDEGFGSLKPYVCLKPLCLYQYMSLGLGPRLEWEILAQPYVVDLLVSLCYAAAASGRLKEFPIGMNLVVPLIHRPITPHACAPVNAWSQAAMPGTRRAPLSPMESFSCTWNLDSSCLLVEMDEEKGTSAEKLKPGDWIVLLGTLINAAAHCRVKSVELPRIWLDRSIFVPCPYRESLSSLTEESLGGDPSHRADCYLYDKNFDSLTQGQQEGVIMTLLDALPPVTKMHRYLQGQGKNQEPNLKGWSDRIPEPTLNLLRWIVASNRSCIMQVDDIGGKDGPVIRTKPEDRVGGMETWIQFRFAQGAPDKEKRFNDSVKRRAQITGTKYPTLFAWHGSRIGNWHSIIRQGLRYDEVLNGRAYGDGIYMSRFALTSLQYALKVDPYLRNWPHSVLNIATVLSLQEVVNDPAEFSSTHPHYVVPKVDWVQTRYLFVETKGQSTRSDVGGQVYEQEPGRQVYNEANKLITIPITAISEARRPGGSIDIGGTPRRKRTKTISETDMATAEQQEDDTDSVVSDADDLAVLQEGEQASEDLEPLESNTDAESLCVVGRKRPAEVAADTDFVPGKLDVTNIKFMEAPEDATSIATKALMRLLKDALKTQENNPPAILGWYIDRCLISNMYQWIVELHSFPSDLPLAKDMKNVGVTSIVIEMRFTSQYPFSPPFIRVVKPRFLPFNRGGGGNVTEGGAMCMEVLTNNGWTVGLTVENLLLQVRLVMSDTERPARLAGHPGSTYGIGEAKAAYIRACHNHGWKVPEGFETIS